MPAREDGGHDLFDNICLPDDGPAKLIDDLHTGLAELGEVFTDFVGGHGGHSRG